MMKKTFKKLFVSRTTVRNLNGPDLERVAGGQTLTTCTDLCTDPDLCDGTANPRFCNLDTQFIHGCAG
jgi:hypothetical protein